MANYITIDGGTTNTRLTLVTDKEVDTSSALGAVRIFEYRV